MACAHPVSLQSIRLELVARGSVVGTATGFAVDAGSHPFLVTSWQVVTGRDNVTGDLLGPVAPDTVRIHHRQAGTDATTAVDEPLIDEDGLPLWATHPTFGSLVDVVALPLTVLDGVALHCRRLVDLDAAGQADLALASDVSIVGFPLDPGPAGGPPVWARGTVATEHGSDHDGRPCFLVDVRARSGQRGAPVLVRTAPEATSNGGGPHAGSGGVGTTLIGVYSGQVSPDLDLGYVWRSAAVVEVLVHAQSRAILRRFTA